MALGTFEMVLISDMLKVIMAAPLIALHRLAFFFLVCFEANKYKNESLQKQKRKETFCCSDGSCDRCSSVGWVEVQQQNPNPCKHNSASIVSTGKITFWGDSSSRLAENLSTCINSKSSLILIKVKKKKKFYLMTERLACSLWLL